MPIADPMTYISKIGEKAGISGQTQGFALNILREAKKEAGGFWQRPHGIGSSRPLYYLPAGK